jgi:hypothetical protein
MSDFQTYCFDTRHGTARVAAQLVTVSDCMCVHATFSFITLPIMTLSIISSFLSGYPVSCLYSVLMRKARRDSRDMSNGTRPGNRSDFRVSKTYRETSTHTHTYTHIHNMWYSVSSMANYLVNHLYTHHITQYNSVFFLYLALNIYHVLSHTIHGVKYTN